MAATRPISEVEDKQASSPLSPLLDGNDTTPESDIEKYCVPIPGRTKLEKELNSQCQKLVEILTPHSVNILNAFKNRDQTLQSLIERLKSESKLNSIKICLMKMFKVNKDFIKQLILLAPLIMKSDHLYEDRDGEFSDEDPFIAINHYSEEFVPRKASQPSARSLLAEQLTEEPSTVVSDNRKPTLTPSTSDVIDDQPIKSPRLTSLPEQLPQPV